MQATVDALRGASLVVESSGGRVMRYAHNSSACSSFRGRPWRCWRCSCCAVRRRPASCASTADRLHRFADISAVEGYLQELAARPAGALVVELPRAPGARETRWAHLLSGAPQHVADAPGPSAEPLHATADLAELARRVAALEARIEALDAAIAGAIAQRGSAT